MLLPKLVTVLRDGYGLAELRKDALSGLTVAIVALPLAMAIAIASGTTPDRGLVTAIIAGFIISAVGGSRHQIGGPTAAFVIVVYGVIHKHGYDGLLLATLMAGGLLLLAGLFRLGSLIRFIPHPVITGFTAGIAVTILSTQVKDFFGLGIAEVPADFIDKLAAFAHAAPSWQPLTLLIAALSLGIIIALRRWRPTWPGFLIAIAIATLLVLLFDLPVETIQSRFGAIPSSLPSPALPQVSAARLLELLPAAFTIALLAGIESLLSCVIADAMTGRHHRSNIELISQGLANIVSPLFGGLPATGALARTATNIRAGAHGPVSGMLHALFLLLFMLAFAPLAGLFPLAALAALLVVVAWNMSEWHQIQQTARGPKTDFAVLLITLALTVLLDLTIAIAAGTALSYALKLLPQPPQHRA